MRSALASLAVDAEQDSSSSIHLLLADGTTASVPQREFGDYDVIEEIGCGGMGVIYKARQRGLDRVVALKLIRSASLAPAGAVTRFRTEAAAAARLQHPHIVAIYEIGEHANQPFYSMEFVPGQSLAQVLRHGPLAPRDAAGLLKSVAAAIHFAHQHGVLHRDLKPSNILLDAENQPRVADFGLAKLLHSDSELTLSGAVIGSPQYMPPEQAGGRSAQADARSDVYSLGAILYETLTGHAPFSAATALETMKLVEDREPIAPCVLNPALPRDLETICLKCLAKEPAARYATAGELAEELGRFLCDEPLHARPVTFVERVWRWCRRKPAIAGLAAVLALAPAVIITVLLVMSAKVAGERNRAVVQGEITRQNLYAENVALAWRALNDNDYGAAWRSLNAHVPTNSIPPGQTDLRGFEWRWLWQRVQGEARKALDAHLSGVNTIAYSPDGRYVVSSSSDGTVKLWNSSREELVRTFVDHRNTKPLKAYTDQEFELALYPAATAYFTADNRGLLIGGSGIITLWDPATGQQRWSLITNSLTAAVCSPVDKGLAMARPVYACTNVAFIDLTLGQPTAIFANGRTDAFCFAPDGRQFARWDRDLRKVCIQSVPDGKVIAWLDPGRIYIITMAFTPDGRTLALGNYVKGTVELFDVATRKQIGHLQGRAGRLRALAISPDGRTLAFGGHDQTIHLWDLASQREIRQLHGHRTIVYALAFSPDGSRLASGGHDGTVRFWDLSPCNEPPSITNVFGPFAFSRDSRRLLTQDTNGTARLWELADRRQVQEWPAHFESASFTSGETVILASLGSSNQSAYIQTCNLPGGTNSTPVRLGDVASPFSAIALSADGAWAVTGHADGTVAVWEARTGRLRSKSKEGLAHQGKAFKVETLVVSANGESFAACSFERTSMKNWTLPDLHPGTFRWFGNIYPMTLAISPDGRRFATGGAGQGLEVNVWNASRRDREMDLRGHLDSLVAAAFAPDGRTLATGAADGSLKLWNLATRRDVITLLSLDQGVQIAHLTFSPDGTWLGAADNRGILHLFHAPIPAQSVAEQSP